MEACGPSTEPTKSQRTAQPLRIPKVVNGGTLSVANGSVDLWPGISSSAILINGAFLGPTIAVRKGETVNVQFINSLGEDSNIHWHGLTTPSVMDGHPKDPVSSGKSFTYTFPVLDRAGTYWYHAHPDRKTARQAYFGLAGGFVVTDSIEESLNLPTGENDIPLIIQDKRLSASGEMIYAPVKEDMLNGFLGDVPLVNGTPNAFLDVSKTLYRLRFVNGSNARLYKIGFEDSRKMYLIATDGGLIEKPIEVINFYLSPGERAEVLVDFSNDAMGSSTKLKSLAYVFNSDHNTKEYPQGMDMTLVTMNVTKDSTIKKQIPASLTALDKLPENEAMRTRKFPLTMDHMRAYGMHQIDGKVFEMDKIDYQLKLGDIEIWEFENQGESVHGMHVHGTQFQVLERLYGDWQLQPTDLGWKDTVFVGPNETVRVIIRFSSYEGIYLLHCHNLEHEDDGMMVNLEVI